MRFFGRKEKRAENTSSAYAAEDVIISFFPASDNITRKEALEIPAVQFCVELISGIISALPLKLYEEKDDKVEEIKDDPRTCILNGDTGDVINGTMFRRLWVQDYFLSGGAYAYIKRSAYGIAQELYYVEPGKVCAVPGTDAIFKDYSLMVDGKTYPKSDFIKILRNSRGTGKGTSIVSECGKMLATGYNTLLYENSIVKKGGNKKGFFTSQQQQTKGTMEAIKEAWRKMNSSNSSVEDNVGVLNAGMDFKEVSSTAMEMQLNQNKKTNSAEICGIFGVPSEMMSGNVSEQVRNQFITDVLTPLLNIFETAFDSDLLLESEKGKRYFAFDTRELTRGDILRRYQAYEIGKRTGFLTPDDIREQEDLPPIGFPFIQLGLGDVLYDPRTGKIYTPNTGMEIDMNSIGTPEGAGINIQPEVIDERARELRFNENHDPESGRFTSGDGGSVLSGTGNGSSGVDKSGESGIIKENIYIGKSLGAAGKNYPVKIPEGGHAKFAEGTEITDVKVFAGKGTNKPIKNAIFLESDYGVKADEWQKLRGTAYVTKSGKTRKAEVHWYEGGDEKVQFKVKRYYDDES